LNEKEVNAAWVKWKELFLNVCDKHAPLRRKTLRGMKCPWLMNETKKLMNERDYFLKKARRSGAEVDWSAYRRLRNRVTNRIRRERCQYHRRELQDPVNNPKSFWKKLKNVFPSSKGKLGTPESIKLDEGEIITDHFTIAENFNDFFTTAVSKLMKSVKPDVNPQSSNEDFTDQTFALKPVRDVFVYKQLKDLKVNKATGLDKIAARHLKDSASVMAPSLTYIS